MSTCLPRENSKHSQPHFLSPSSTYTYRLSLWVGYIHIRGIMIMNEPEPPSPPPVRGPSPRPAQDHYLVGIGLLLVVVALWVGSSFLMSSMFRDEEWNRPWLVTYICTSSFTLYLIRPGLSYLHTHGLSIKPLAPDPKLNARKNSHPASPVQAAYTLVDDQDRELSRSENRPTCVTRAFSVPESPLTTKEIAHLAATFVLLWFAANWSVNAALGYTSVSSTTILSSMSGFFTLAIGVATGAERFSLGRLLAVAMSVTGVVLVSKSDHSAYDPDPSDKTSSHWILGDVLALSSAALYALYVILMKVKVKEESRVDMQLFFGFVGAINMLCFWPMGVALHYTGIEPFSFPHTRKLWLSVILNAMCTFISDYIYMLAMLKTSPLVVTLGISLTLPVAVIGDIFKGIILPPTSLIGAGLVLSSFVILSLVEQQQ
ncbi:uncharacterized protein PGTG_19385 [Puccinia graminis f. sp. tritici CRL 75-36-700-3]|uniref:EamA domain-containing protein n=1 Tax=Puccinia graminis f. sp. tritici (strain CRL 75-36-700-3 / race SCCL) TaxID=418459 RepID=E3LA98_PUCGT|nr:uncharacterized protein PGTG_19385 [Puccinia graminis f. sp. tritici CRL 75-36-700-3]EFP93473.1 hypothetical protein PGTG_19385 [Puccinia graminis f. sp. tritici CRL 75-36-700-3]